MLQMLQRFAIFFTVFGLSYVIQSLGWTDQGTAFLWLYIGCLVIISSATVFMILFVGDRVAEKLGLSFVEICIVAGLLGICLFATWGATQLFDVSFTTAFQIMLFGQCLYCD